MIAVTFEIVACEPLLVTRLEGDPNSSVSYPYLPGGALRGALVSRYLPDVEFDLPGDAQAKRLFFSGATRYLNAYPLDRLGGRGLPAPLCWLIKKGEPLEQGATIYDASVEVVDLEQPKGLGERFCRLEDAQVEFVELEWQINIHTARERVKGRATRQEGAVFRYQALAADQRFGGAILVSNPDDASLMKELLEAEEGELWLGGSRSGGYGRARVRGALVVEDWTEPPERAGAVGEWQDDDVELATGQIGDLKPGDSLTLTLLSDTILRGATGGYADDLAPDLLPAALRNALRAKTAYKRVAPVGGFNCKWGLPLVQAYAIQAGSLFVYEVTQPVGTDTLRRLEETGVGLRRVDGFGRLAANWHTDHGRLSVRQVKRRAEQPGEVSLSPKSQALAGRMLERLLRRELDRRLNEYIYRMDLGTRRWPSNAQLSRLRAIALNALPERELKRLSDFLAEDNLKARAREQYRQARVEGGVRLLDWLQQRVAAPSEIWARLGVANEDLPRVGDTKIELSDELAREYTIRLVAGVLHRAGKERGDE